MNGAVLDLKTDILWNKIPDHFDIRFDNAPPSLTSLERIQGTFDEKWSGAIRIRVGFARDKILSFLADGIAYTSIETNNIVLALVILKI